MTALLAPARLSTIGVSWVRAAACSALTLPVTGAEARVWASRSLAELALGCLLLPNPAPAVAALDDIVAAAALGPVGPVAERLRRVRALCGPVPPGYPTPVPVPARPTGPRTARAAAALLAYCMDLAASCGPALDEPVLGPLTWFAPPLVPRDLESGAEGTARELLAWGARLRPAPFDHGTVRVVSAFGAGVAWRTWFRMPDGVTVVERPAIAPTMARAVWRGVHDGAHLDHLAAAPEGEIEYGSGLLVAEAYAMAVEIVAAGVCALRGRHELTQELCRGLAERVERLPRGGSSELAALPTLAAAYVLGPLEMLAGDDGALPERMRWGLRNAWAGLTERNKAAARLARAARGLLMTRGEGL